MAFLSSFGSMIPRAHARLRVFGLLSSCLLLLLLLGAATAAPSKASAAKISAHLTKASFKSSQARSVKLIYKFSAPSRSFSYLLTFKKGSKWQTVKSVKKSGSFRGSKSMTVQKVFSGKSVKVGSYRLKLSADGGSKVLGFKVVKGKSGGTTPTGSKPTNNSLPAISGTTTQGQTLSASSGSWSNSSTTTSYARQWRRCDLSGANCSDISGATSGTYVLALADVGKTIRVVVTASNSYGSSNATSGQTAVVIGLPSPTPLRFNLSSAVGLALGSTTLSGSQTSAASTTFMGAEDNVARYSAAAVGSNLDAVSSSGTLSDAVTSGSATISQFLIAPNNKVYVLFASRVNLSDTSLSYSPSGCLLAEIDPSSGVPICVDNSLSSISWSFSSRAQNPPIQFDSSGAIYYIGWNASGTRVLRKYLNGVSTDLITDNVYIDHFVVSPDGSVFLSGQTTSTGARWVRRISPGGSLSGLRDSDVFFLELFPDNNVYMGGWNGSVYGVARYLTASTQMESKYWIGGDDAVTGGFYFDSRAICSGAGFPPSGGPNLFCEYSGSMITSSLKTSDGSEYVIAGDHGYRPNYVMQYYPTVRFISTSLSTVTIAQAAVNNLVLGGLNTDSKNVLTLYNTSDDTETQLIGPDNEIEIYHVNNAADTNKILFDGLRFADNKYVIEEIDLSTKQITELDSSSVKWTDLQTFH